uniref:Uncharacterized protein n=1 Tax=Megaselia scalaris TaxID=36166 RepID=T1GH99_MEGSC
MLKFFTCASHFDLFSLPSLWYVRSVISLILYSVLELFGYGPLLGPASLEELSFIGEYIFRSPYTNKEFSIMKIEKLMESNWPSWHIL